MYPHIFFKRNFNLVSPVQRTPCLISHKQAVLEIAMNSMKTWSSKCLLRNETKKKKNRLSKMSIATEQ